MKRRDTQVDLSSSSETWRRSQTSFDYSEGQATPEWIASLDAEMAEYAKEREALYQARLEGSVKLSEPMSEKDHDWTHHVDL